jgi:hypothetical protein
MTEDRTLDQDTRASDETHSHNGESPADACECPPAKRASDAECPTRTQPPSECPTHTVLGLCVGLSDTQELSPCHHCGCTQTSCENQRWLADHRCCSACNHDGPGGRVNHRETDMAMTRNAVKLFSPRALNVTLRRRRRE